VEVKYYIIFGLLYFYKGEIKAIVAISVLFVMAEVLMSLAKVAPQIPYITQAGALMSTLSLRHFGWFAAGSLMYLYTLKHDKKLIGYALAVGFFSAVSVMLGKSLIVLLFSLAVLAIFIAAVYFDNFKKVFESKILLYVGFISYPMYLIHENAMIALIIKLNHYTNGAIPDFLLPIMPILFLMGLAHLITQYFEPLVRNTLKRLLPV
jgi:peptidoglycan/LPS O-acetylase OafA/YrhL